MYFTHNLERDKFKRQVHRVTIPAGQTYGDIVLDVMQSLADDDADRAFTAMRRTAQAVAGKFGTRETVAALIEALHGIEAGQVIGPVKGEKAPLLSSLGNTPTQTTTRKLRRDRRAPRPN